MKTEFLTKAICLNSIDYKEKDKQLTLFSLECGKITAVLKGVKNAKAKLKFAYSPFCFAEYQMAQNGNFKTVTNATLIDSFFDLTTNIEGYYSSMAMLDITNHVIKFDEQNVPVFILLLNSLKAICYEQKSPKLVLVKFCLDILQNLGYKLHFKNCTKCSLPYTSQKNLDLSSGELVCNNCKTLNSIVVSNVAFNTLKNIDNTTFDRLSTLKVNENTLNECIELLLQNIECRIEQKIKSRKLLSQI